MARRVQIVERAVKLPPVIQLRPYQQRWIDDDTRFKLAVKSARIGFSYATGLEAIFDCLKQKTTWTVLSASMPQSIEFIDQTSRNIEAIKATAEAYDEPFTDEMGATDILVKCVRFPNGSRIIALPANPRTARGYPGNAVLDEYAHHEGSYGIWAAVSRQVALGHKLRALSTPNGEQGKFFDLAKEFSLTDGVAPPTNPVQVGAWSCHWVDVLTAIREGCPINLDEMRDLYRGDDETFRQEFYCAFLKAVGAWLDVALISAAEDDAARVDMPLDLLRQMAKIAPLYAGIDFGRSGDRSCLWIDQYVGEISTACVVEWKFNTPFFSPDKKDQVHWLEPYIELVDRVALDSTGMGIPLYEYFNSKYPAKVMGVNFGGSIKRMELGEGAAARGLAENVKIKTDMAVRMKRRMEQRKNRIPRHMDIRQELQAIKREQAAGGGITFDAPRIELDTPSGGKRKVYSHAEAFWAKAMCDLAAAQPVASLANGYMAGTRRPSELGLERVSREF
jgi:phage FluMu gp28-like protein